LSLYQSNEEFDKVLETHKSYVRQRFPEYSGSGQDAYADAGDLGADPETLKAEKLKATNGTNGHSLHTNGNGNVEKKKSNGLTNGNHHAKSIAALA